MSVDYYVRLEQGRSPNVSDSVLDAVARVLRLSDAERHHLATLAHPPAPTGLHPGEASQSIAVELRLLLDAMSTVPAFVLGRRTDVLAWNTLAGTPLNFDTLHPHERNSAWYVFMHPDAPRLYPDWEQVAAQTVAYLALDAGRHPDDPDLERLVGELAIASASFRELWARHDVLEGDTGSKRVDRPLTGTLDLRFQTLQSPSEPEQLLVALLAEPHSLAEQNLRLLTSWGESSGGVAQGTNEASISSSQG